LAVIFSEFCNEVLLRGIYEILTDTNFCNRRF
jgi:hypothetical protein